MEQTLWRDDATARERAIAIVEDLRQRGILVGRVLDATVLRKTIEAAILTHTTKRLTAAETRLLRDGYDRCAACSKWVYLEDAERSHIDDTAVYCSRTCRDDAEPRCEHCGVLPQRSDGYCSDACRRAAKADHDYHDWRDRQMEVA